MTSAKDRDQYSVITERLDSIMSNIQDFKELRNVTNERLAAMTEAIQSISDRVAVQNGRVTKLESHQAGQNVDAAVKEGVMLLPKKVGWLLTQKAVWQVIAGVAAGTFVGREILVAFAKAFADIATKAP